MGNLNMARTVKAPTNKGDLRRLAILEAATQVFHESGFNNASLNKIIELSGGSKRSLYDYFGDKEALFSAVVEDKCAEILDNFSAVTLSDKPARQTLNELGFKFARAVIHPERVALFRIVISEMPRFPNLGKRFYEVGPAAAQKILSPYLQKTFSISSEQADCAAMQFLEMVKSPLHMAVLLKSHDNPTDDEIRVHVKSAVDIFLGGINALN